MVAKRRHINAKIKHLYSLHILNNQIQLLQYLKIIVHFIKTIICTPTILKTSVKIPLLNYYVDKTLHSIILSNHKTILTLPNTLSQSCTPAHPCNGGRGLLARAQRFRKLILKIRTARSFALAFPMHLYAQFQLRVCISFNVTSRFVFT